LKLVAPIGFPQPPQGLRGIRRRARARHTMAPKKAADGPRKDGEESKKRKAEDKKDEGAARKEAKKDPKQADVDEAEMDAPVDKRATVKETVTFDPMDMTLNAVPTLGGKLLLAHSDGGMQYFIAGARASVGVKAGRYMYEVRIVEHLNPIEASAKRPGPAPRQLVRVGFSTAGSELVLGEDVNGICFDSEGVVFAEGNKIMGKSQKFGRDQVVAVLLNLDATSANANTVSLFRDGVRITEPFRLSESLCGKPLFPHVAYRNVSLQMNFGPHPIKALPFKCRGVQSAAQADVVVTPSSRPKTGKYEVLFPVGFPDEGTFDWLDMFLVKNNRFVELSDRKIVEWASKSGMVKNKSLKDSNDKPDFNYGILGMDDLSVQRVIRTVAPLVPRNYVVMEVRANLLPDERAEALRRFGAHAYKRVAHVVMGEPSAEYRTAQRELILKAKQEKVNAEWNAKRAEKERKKQIELRQKQLDDMRKKAEDNRRKVAKDVKKKVEDVKRRSEEETKAEEVKAEPKGDDAEEAKEEMKEEQDDAKEELKDEPKTEDNDATMEAKEEEDDDKEEEDDNEPPSVELTAEEQAIKFRTLPQPDLTSLAMSQSFGHFTIPEKSEGFDEIRYEWQSATKSKEYLRTIVLDKKIHSKIEDLQPSKWFQDKNAEWLKTFKMWEGKQKSFKATVAKKAAEKKQDGDDDKKDDEEQEGDDLDIFSVEDVCDVGSNEPLFANFGFEDWALLQLRYELWLLAQAYKKDVDDPERIGIHDANLAYYYNKYFHKQLSPKHFCHNTNHELTEMIKDTVVMTPGDQVLSAQLTEDVETADIFVKLTEEQRRERQRRIDAGDETVRLKFTPMAMQQPQPQRPAPASAASSGRTTGPTGAAAAAAAAAALGAQANWRGAAMGRWPPGAQAGYGPRPPGAVWPGASQKRR